MLRFGFCSKTVYVIFALLLVAGCGSTSKPKLHSIVGSDAPNDTTSTTSDNGSASTTSTTSDTGTTTGGASAKDVVPPDTSIVGGPSGLVNSKAASFTFTGKDDVKVAGFACRLNTASWASCVSPKMYSNLTNAVYTFEVRAVDSSGNVDAIPATRSWTVDTVPPSTSISSAPTALTNSSSASFKFSTVGGSTFECDRDGDGYASCTSPKNYTGLADGAHTFSVRAIDAAGNVDASPATRSWMVDTTPPSTTITSGASGTVSSTSNSFTFSCTEAVCTYQCAVNGGTFAGCSNPYGFVGQADGSNTLQVRAVDAAGNIDGTPATRIWTVDTLPPDTSIVSGASGPVSSTINSFVFACNEVSCSYQCALNGSVFAGCSSPYNFVGQPDGRNTLQVRAVDAAGNIDGTPATRIWTVDTLPPDTSIVSGASGWVSSIINSFVFACSQGSCSYQCAVNGSAFGGCSNPYAFNGQTDATYVMQVRAIDRVGNVDASPATRTWTVDTLPPDTSIVSGASGLVSSTSNSFAFGCSQGSCSYQCAVNGSAFGGCSNPYAFNGQTDGSDTLQVRAVDAAGNTDASPATRTWTVDSTPPNTSFVSGASGSVSSTSNSFVFTCDPGVCTYQCAVNAGAFAGCITPYAFAGQTDGTYTLQVRAIDVLGNVDATPASRIWTVDTVPPVMTITAWPATSATSISASTNAHFVFACNEVGCATWCAMDGVTAATCSSPVDVTGLTAGTHTFAVTGVDQAGNATLSVASQTWTVSPLPDTGQNSCYDVSSTMSCPAVGQPYYGQDAQYITNPMSFTDHGNSAVSDNVTGLMWEQKTTGNKDAIYTWQGALNHCSGLVLAGYSDWRLPNPGELLSIVSYGAYSPSINTTYFPNTASSYYWSSSSYAYDTNYAWFVSFANGYVYNVDKTYDYYARCVRP